MPGNSYDRIKTPYNAGVEFAFPNIDFMASYQAKVVSQSSDMKSVDIQPIDNALPGMNNIPIFIGVGGITIKLVPGALCMVAFNGGSPSGAFVYNFNSEQIQQITITDTNNDTLMMGNGSLVFKAAGTTLIDASLTAVKLGLVPQLQVLTLTNTLDGMGMPCTSITPIIVSAGGVG